MNKLSSIISKVILLIISISMTKCATSTATLTSMLKTHKNYYLLTEKEKDLLSKVLIKIDDNPRQAYYIEKLIDMLYVPYVGKNNEKFRKKQKKRLKDSVKNEIKVLHHKKSEITKITQREERLQDQYQDGWSMFRPTKSSPFVWVHRKDPLNILVHILIYLEGNREDVEDVKFLEDAIEKHLYMEGFSVNITFVNMFAEDYTFKVKVNHKGWATSDNWTGSKYTLAHELMHLLGLPDEYDKIENHHDNKNMTWESRLRIFLSSIDQEIPDDALDGIMTYNKNKPLQRHICAVAKLGNDCVEKRLSKYGM